MDCSDSIACSSIDASGLRVSRNRLKQIGPSFLMQWPGCPRNEATAVFECDCGVFEAYKVRDVYRAHVTQCLSCNKKKVSSRPTRMKRATKHERSDALTKQRGPHPEYWIWSGMRSRCHNPRSKAYPHYGGRGVQVCERWRDNFTAFLEDMGERPTPEHSIDRIDVNGHYEPDNCRWVTNEAQSYNKRCSTRINGKSLLDISLETGLPTDLIRRRLDAGWSYQKIVSTPAAHASTH